MRSIIFDLDDTLYSERRFVLSGFAAVARYLERQLGVPRGDSFRVLAGELRHGRRSRALQAVCTEFGLAEEIVPRLINVIRTHRPRLRLPAANARLLASLRPGWRIAVLTNGLPALQARKIRALGLAPLVDHVVFACEHSAHGKPDKAPFIETLHRLGAEPHETVLVGDDPWCDIAGARRVGLRTIRLQARRRRKGVVAVAEADVVIGTLSEVARAADRLVPQEKCPRADWTVDTEYGRAV